ncbi:MAG: hypothetical protein JWQ43_860 [Glaciihabitans sp.]|nr:hypothetical protein [Glaciihabitans sp.]
MKTVALTTLGTLALGGVLASVDVNTASAATTTKVVATSAELTAALKSATAGSTITMKDGTYTGRFELTASGKSGAPITLTGSHKAVITTGSTGSGYGMHGTGDYLVFSGFSISKAQKGIVIDSSNNTRIVGLDVGNTGMEAIHVRTSSANAVVSGNVVHDTGIAKAGAGEGIYIGTANSNWGAIMGSSSTPDKSDNVLVQNNTIRNTAAEGIDVKEGTTGGKLLGNTFENSGYSGANDADSWVDVKGNGYLISGNTGTDAKLDAFQVHDVYAGWGRTNTFTNNTITGKVPGYEVQIAGKASLGNIVACDTTLAKKGVTNLACK